MSHLRQNVLTRFTAIGVASLGAVALIVAGGATSAFAATSATTVAASDVANTRPADGGWWQDRDSAASGSFDMTTDSFDGSAAAKLKLPTTASGVNLHDDYPAASRPTDLPALLAGSSYTYTGTNVNFQIEVAYQPADSRFGPSGSSPCTSAAAWGISGVDSSWCYTLLKWEPFAVTSTWSTVDLSAGTAGNSGTLPTPTGGWISQKRIGSYPGTAARVGQTLPDYLAQMGAYQVVSTGFGAGSGALAPTSGWVKNVTIGGVSESFTPTSTTPPPPAATDADLDQYIAANDVDVAATTATFSLDGGTPGTGLTGLDASTPIDASLPWTGSADATVAVYGYSSPIYLGTFPVVNGTVQLTGLDLSLLGPGAHRLVFQGAATGLVSVVAITIAATGSSTDPSLAFTGTDAMMPAMGALVLLLLGAGAFVLARRRSAARSR
jgi:hypothetical protein